MKKVITFAIIMLIMVGIHKLNMASLKHDDAMAKETYYENPGYWYTKYYEEN